MGLSQSVYDSKPTVYGVMPYIAPEVLENEKYTYASDIYSFGIIMAEVSLGKPPYAEYPHDESLALAICNGLRPGLSAGTPEPYCELFRRCTDTVPEKRPSSEEIVTTIKAWLLFDEFEGAEMLRTPPDTTIHSEAFYTSRHLPVHNLSKSSNSGSNNFSQDSFPDSKLGQLSIPKSHSD
ncbi:kinase-like protein [Rhizophagus irregularis]|uniref:Kinase-like protein n=1 Tax=Rhizophagus irregularis TaxID=588596 RepID=A0A2N0PRH1_9GLOM|nr:kinase-like protein [Rhizophagus irregularis]